MEYTEITEKIIGCAYKVYNNLGPGFLESVYEKCMAIEFEKIALHAVFQQPLNVFYEGQQVGNYTADILVEEKVIVELKAVRTLIAAHEVQLVNYLVATKVPIGLLINFGETKVEVKRKVRTLPLNHPPLSC
jgi:GxxExxY protein